METDLAQRLLADFSRDHRGSEMIHLASHAALPVVLNSELVHLLRINFFLDPALDKPLTYIAEAQLLLSPLCSEIDDGLYVIEPDLRDILLKELVVTYGPGRVKEVAMLLGEYTERYAPWSERPGLTQAQQLTALSFVDPERAVQWLEQAEHQAGLGAPTDRRWFVAMRRDLERVRRAVGAVAPGAGLQRVTDAIAAGMLEDGLAQAGRISDPLERGQALVAVASGMLQAGQNEAADSVVDQALAAIGGRVSDLEQVHILIELALALARTPLQTRGASLLELAAESTGEIWPRRDRVAAFVKLGQAYRAAGQLDLAEQWYQDALKLTKLTQDVATEATVLDGLGLIRGDRGERDPAVQSFELALALYRRLDSTIGQTTILEHLGDLYHRLGEKERALELYQQSLVLRRAVADRAGEAIILGNIGGIYSDLGDLTQALAHYEQALPLQRDAGERGGEAATLNNIGLVYDKMGDKAKAIAHYQEALAGLRKAGYLPGQATVLDHLGSVCAELGEPDRALDFFVQSVRLSDQLGDRLGMAKSLEKAAAACESLGDTARALKYLQDATEAYKASGDEQSAKQVLDRRNALAHTDAVTRFKVGDEAVTLEEANLRRTPGYLAKPETDILYSIPARSSITILKDAQIVDSIIWLGVRFTSRFGNTFSGWLAQAKESGTPLLALSEPQKPLRILLSYAREDFDGVYTIYDRLEALGLQPWMDLPDLQPGQRWRNVIAEEIKQADLVLICLSPQAVDKRGFFQREIQTALDAWQEKQQDDIFLIPVRLAACDVPQKLEEFNWVDLYEKDGWKRLLRAIEAGARSIDRPVPSKLMGELSKRTSQQSDSPSEADALRIGSQLVGGPASRILVETFFKEAGFALNQSKRNSLIVTSIKPQYREHGQIPVMLHQDHVARESDMNDAISQIKKLFRDWSGKDEGKEGLRGRIGIVVVGSLEESANLVAAAAKSDSGLGVVVLSFGEIRRAVIEHNEDDMLARQIKITTGEVNLYEIFTPVTNPLDFYGRKTPLATITQLIDKSVPPGIFGLWRIGKTSLLHQLQQQETLLNHVVAYIDCQFWQGTVADLAREIIESLVGEITSRRKDQKLHKLATASAGEQDALVALRTDITAIYNELGYKVVVIFDEIEHAISARVKMKQDYEKLIRALLGLNSEKRIVVPVVCGKYPNQTALVSSQSTILSDFTREFLKPMPKDECKIMIRSFGLRMGIEWDDEGLNRVYEATGGHPYVTRYLCGQVYRQGKQASKRRYLGSDVVGVRDSYLRDPNNYLAKAWDIGIFTEPEKQALQHLALGMIKTNDDVLGSPTAIQRAIVSLVDYGIVIRQHNSISILGESYSSWIANSTKTNP